ncbi:DUF3618 domain-containing protein [Nonomuraea sp. PA05]|uniref:DUF3618 domain-containing protein n=1 Tax=Nonomuraea sp. PA05 TaxID=2604466 RepID=UPI0011D3331C|nr:DUF3618 domain-containing protein [Nonomuraea sp. PA05]TYB68797.1 DUF3618 domain-containing protein [Nonomuraea sp. PA05]
MSETDPGHSEQHAGDVGARRATVGTPTERESINVPPTRPGAADNARRAEVARQEHETFVPEAPIEDERSEAAEHSRTEEESVRGAHGDDEEEEEDAVRRDIQETRREMGETVSQLAAKADVKARAGHAAEVAKERAVGAADTVKGKAFEVADKVRENTPDQVKDAAAEARKRPVVLFVAIGAVTAFVVRRMMKRRRTTRK